jgi:hypothetical protein
MSRASFFPCNCHDEAVMLQAALMPSEQLSASSNGHSLLIFNFHSKLSLSLSLCRNVDQRGEGKAELLAAKADEFPREAHGRGVNIVPWQQQPLPFEEGLHHVRGTTLQAPAEHKLLGSQIT